MRILITLCLFASSISARALDFCGEWKGEDGNTHIITSDKWTVVLPNGLKKERAFGVNSIIETKDRAGVWIYFSAKEPMEAYYCRFYDDGKRIVRMGPYERPGSIPSPRDPQPQPPLTIHLHRLDEDSGKKLKVHAP